MKNNNIYSNDTFYVNYVIYEKNDTKILLDGFITKNDKNYFTSIPIDPHKFNFLCEKTIGYERTYSLWCNLFNSHDQVVELAPENHLGIPLNFSSLDSILNIN